MNIKNQTIMEKERKITAPEGCEIEKVELIDGVAVVTFKEKERKLPKSWEEFCTYHPIPLAFSLKQDPRAPHIVSTEMDLIFTLSEFTGNRFIAEAVLSLIKLIQLRNCYNGDWVPDWTDNESKFTIDFIEAGIFAGEVRGCCTLLYFKRRELRDEFRRNFRPLIEKLKPLYNIKEGGEK